MRLSLAKAASKHNQKQVRAELLRSRARFGGAAPPRAADGQDSTATAGETASVAGSAEESHFKSLVIPVPLPSVAEVDEKSEVQAAIDSPAVIPTITDSDAAAALLADLDPSKRVATAVSDIQPIALKKDIDKQSMPVPGKQTRQLLTSADALLRQKLFSNKQLLGQLDGSRSKAASSGGGLLLGKATPSSTAAAIHAAPPEPDMKSFAQVPVESFGDAVLRGMGATDDALAGRDGVYEADAPRSMRGEFTGLGATRDPRVQAELEERRRRRRRNAHAAAADDERDDASSHRRQRRFAGLVDGAIIRIVAGPYRGKLALILATDGVPGLDRIRVRLDSLEARVARKVDADAVSDLSTLTHAEQAKIEAMRSLDEEEEAPELPSAAATTAAAKRVRSEPSESASGHALIAQKPRLSWLIPGIRVRVSDSTVLGGRVFRKKAVVLRMLPATTPLEETAACALSMDGSNELVNGVAQTQLQTALPKPGGAIMCVAGQYVGRKGVLIARSSASGEAEIELHGAVDRETVALPFEQLAEWVGHA